MPNELIMFRVFRSDWYSKKLSKLEKSEQSRIEKIEQSLKTEPYSGKPLGFEFFREKKFDGKRILLLVYNEYKMVFLVTITDKKLQQEEINLIRKNLDAYREIIKKIMSDL